MGLYGAGSAFFIPAFDAIVPDLLPPDDLARRTRSTSSCGPSRCDSPDRRSAAGWSGMGTGVAFAVNAASFGASAIAVLLMRPPARPWRETPEPALRAVKQGLRFVRRRVWLWGTLLSAALSYLVFLGPAEVLLPFVVKNDLHASAGMLGLVFAAGGLGAVGAAIVMAQRREPRHNVTFMYVAWTLATLAVAGYGLATAAWQLMLACLVFNALETAGTIVWATMKQRHVPASMLGRVSSLDWMISIGLLPLSFALTAPVAGALGARTTLIGAALLGGALTLSALFLPGMRDLERVHDDGAVVLSPPLPASRAGT